MPEPRNTDDDAPSSAVATNALAWPAWLIGVLAATLVLLLVWLVWWWFAPASGHKPAQVGTAVVGVIGGMDSETLAPGEELLKIVPRAQTAPAAATPAAEKAQPQPAPQAVAQPAATPTTTPAPVFTPTAPSVATGSAQVQSTRPVCLSCGWVESVVVLPTAASVPPGVVTAVAAAQGAQAAQQAMPAVKLPRGMASDPTVGATAGAMAGALIGSSLERRAPPGPSSVYEVHIRMEDGSLRTYEQAQAPPLGTKVVFEGGQPRWLAPLAPQASPGGKVYSSY